MSMFRSSSQRSPSRLAAPLIAACAGLALSLSPASLANIGGAKCPPPPAPGNEPRPALTVVPAVAASMPSSDIAKYDEPAIRIAICLDTSGSMEGLLNQARTRLWDVVNFLSTAKYSATTPTFQVALFQYGSDQLPSSEGYMRCVQPFTTDLDLISERLFSLTISGSSEYCGQVMSKAANELTWHSTPYANPNRPTPHYSTIVIVGNEEFTQGPIDYQPIAKQLKHGRIYLNTIYCGSYAEGERTGWLNAAYLNGGSYCNIDQDKREEYIPCPQDGRLSELNTELNGTYLAYSAAGRENKARQEMQDSANAAASKEAYYQRAASKSSAAYRNDSWDILDALDKGTIKLEDIPSDQLPEKMRPMTLDERRAYIEELKARRTAIQAELRKLNEEREAFLRDRRKRPAGEASNTLDTALIKSIREQAQKLGFTFSRD